MPLPPPQSPPAIAVPAPSGQEAEGALLEAYDWGRPLPKGSGLKGPVALEYRWLQASATFDPARDLPANPFATGARRQEAEALRHLLRAPRERLMQALKALPLKESGTALALWRWGQAQVRSGTLDAGLRRTWEDRLLRKGPALTRGYALRHALCWALAEQDEARFAALRNTAGDGAADFSGMQRLFGLLGGPSPLFRLWALPGLSYRDLSLDQLGGSRLWICPMEDDRFPVLPPGTRWIIPSAAGELDEREASLPETIRSEANAIAARLEFAKRTASFAPSRQAFEHLGLVWFPILIELDDKGNIQSVRMGDAAPQKP